MRVGWFGACSYCMESYTVHPVLEIVDQSRVDASRPSAMYHSIGPCLVALEEGKSACLLTAWDLTMVAASTRNRC